MYVCTYKAQNKLGCKIDKRQTTTNNQSHSSHHKIKVTTNNSPAVLEHSHQKTNSTL